MKAFGYSLIILGSLIMVLLLIDMYQNSTSDVKADDGSGYHVVVIDSCEYLVRQSGYSGYMAHKGNCRFCAIRIRQQITHTTHHKIPLVE